METRIALIGIIVEDMRAADRLNAILHEFAGCIVGRMGHPLPRERRQHHQRGRRRAEQRDQLPFGQARDAPRRQHQDGLFQGRRSPA